MESFRGERRWYRHGIFLALALGALACGAADRPGECAGPGVYSRGKEGGPSCCPGFEELHRLVVSGRPDALSCEPPPGHAEFGCIEGRCGDGVCELGERGMCGCTQDCAAEGASSAPP